ncbi:MAG: thermonuclease family protein [Myxococcota bacterium]
MRALTSALLLLTCAASACGSPCGPTSGTVQAVVDGDTFDLSDGRRVRLLLVDTPETTGGKNDCYGQEATAYTKSVIEGVQVQLSYDDAACTDRFGRTLAYVKQGEVELNSELVKRGLACSLFIAPGGQARAEEFETYEAEAKTSRTGMWGMCTNIPCDQ